MQPPSLAAPSVPAAGSPAQSLAACRSAGLLAVRSGRLVAAVLALREHPQGGVAAVVGLGIDGGTIAPVVAAGLPAVAPRVHDLRRAAPQLRALCQRVLAASQPPPPVGAAPREIGPSRIVEAHKNVS